MDSNQLTTIVTSNEIDLAVIAWLDAKFHHSSSEKTRSAYTETMRHFRGLLSAQGLDLTSNPAHVALTAQAFAGSSVKGRQISAATYNQRLAILSSFFIYARKQGQDWLINVVRNPIETLDRAKVQAYGSARALRVEQVAVLMGRIDQSEASGARDYALLSVLLETGRRAQETAVLTWGDVKIVGNRATIEFNHCKGGKKFSHDISAGATNALRRWMVMFYGFDLIHLPANTPVWVSMAHDPSYGKALGYQGIRSICSKRLGTSRVHVTRHTFAHTMELAGAPTSKIQAALGHEDMGTTGKYLQGLNQSENQYVEELASMYGIK